MKLIRCIGIPVLILAMAAGARADTWCGHSIEHSVSNADLIVRGTVDRSEKVAASPTSRQFSYRATITVKEVLKGKAGETLECLLPYDDQQAFAPWQENKTELLLCLAKSERYRLADSKEKMPCEWAVMPCRGRLSTAIPLDGKADQRAPTVDFVFLTKPKDILARVADVIASDTANKVARQPDGSVASLEMVGFLPSDSQFANVGVLVIPITPYMAIRAREWLQRGMIGPLNSREIIAILAHFKSDENIGAMRAILNAPKAGSPEESPELGVRNGRRRAAALEVLKAWGVETEGVTTQPNR